MNWKIRIFNFNVKLGVSKGALLKFNKFKNFFWVSILKKILSEIISNSNFNFKNRWSNGQNKTSSPRLEPSCSHLTAPWALQIALMCYCVHMTSEPPVIVLLLTHKHRFHVDFPLKPHVLHSSSAFRSGTSAPFLGKNKYICGRLGVTVGTMNSRGPSEDLARGVRCNNGPFNDYRNHVKWKLSSELH